MLGCAQTYTLDREKLYSNIVATNASGWFYGFLCSKSEVLHCPKIFKVFECSLEYICDVHILVSLRTKL